MGGKPCFFRAFSISTANCAASGSTASGAEVSVVYTSAGRSEGTVLSDPCGDDSTSGTIERLTIVLGLVAAAAQPTKKPATRRLRRQTAGLDAGAMGEIDPSKPSKKAAGQMPSGL